MFRTGPKSSEGSPQVSHRAPVRYRWSFPIGWRVSIGFGIFAVAVGLLFWLIRLTLEENRKLAQDIEKVYLPGIQLLTGLETTVEQVALGMDQWVSGEAQDPVLLERQLEQWVRKDLPDLMGKTEQLASLMDSTALRHWERLRSDVDLVSIVYTEVSYRIASDAPVPDSSAIALATEYVKGEANLPTYLSRFRVDVDVLKAHQLAALTASTARLQQVGALLGRDAGRIAFVVLVLGVLISLAVTRSITRPIRDLRRTLLYMGRGIQPERPVPVTPDEIGEMAEAVNRLSEGMRRTQVFSQEVGQGNFSADYEPLSEDDALGHALVKMRESLASSEIEMERKVRLRTTEVREQKSRIEQLYGDLMDSINYAKRIQDAILPSAVERAKVFQDSMVFYRPRDVVSGDFYWFHSVGRVRMFAAIDCTGHGVPGAFMSLIGYNVLERVTKVYTEPEKVLGQLNRQAGEILRPKGSRVQTDRSRGVASPLDLASLGIGVEVEQDIQMTGLQDGMDLAVVSIDREQMSLQYSGANCPLYIVRRRELIELKPDKWAIGSFEPETFSYGVQHLSLEPGDVIFAATDGFVDQFGGPAGKKFMRHRFRELMVEVAPLPMVEMEQTFAEVFDQWRNEEEQVDDVLVIAVRV